MSTQFLKGGPGSGRHAGDGKDSSLTKEIKVGDSVKVKSDSGGKTGKVVGVDNHRVEVLHDKGGTTKYHESDMRVLKSMKVIFNDALKGGPGSGRHAGVVLKGERANTDKQHEAAVQHHADRAEALHTSGNHVVAAYHESAAKRHTEAVGKSSEKVSTGLHAMRNITYGGLARTASGIANGKDRNSDSRKSSSFKSLSESIEIRVDELSLKGGPGSGRHPGSGPGKEPSNKSTKVAHTDAAGLHIAAADAHAAADKIGEGNKGYDKAAKAAHEASDKADSASRGYSSKANNSSDAKFSSELALRAAARDLHSMAIANHNDAATAHREAAKT